MALATWPFKPLAVLAIALAFAPLPAQSGAVDLRGLYVGGNDITGGADGPLTAALNLEAIDGLLLNIGWDAVEPSKGVYQWAVIDQWMQLAASSHKKVTISVGNGLHTPTWLFQSPPAGGGATPLFFSITRKGGRADSCLTETIAAPWDPALLAQWDAMLAALSDHLKSTGTYSSLVLVRLSGFNKDSDELHLPSETPESAGLACVTNADSVWKKAGYKPSVLLNAWDVLTTSYQHHFPDKSFTVAIIASVHPFPAIAEDGSLIVTGLNTLSTVQNQPLMTLAEQKFPAHLIIQNNSLYPDVPAQSETVGFAQTLGSILAFQTNEDISTGSGKSASCTKFPAPFTSCTDSAYLQLLETGIYPLGRTNPLRAQYIEVFAADAVTLPASIAAAHAELVPTPTIASVSPLHSAAGAALTITVTGTNYVPSSQISFNGKAEATTFVSATQLSAAVGAADNNTGGPVSVAVVRSPIGLGASAPAPFTADNFSIAPATSASTLAAGQSASVTLTVAPSTSNGFPNPVVLSASGLPVGAAAVFSQNPVTPGNAGATATLTITTTARGSLVSGMNDGADPSMPLALSLGGVAIALAIVVTSWAGAGIRTRRAVAVGSTLACGIALGCGSASEPSTTGGSGTPQGVSQILVTATSGTVSQQVGITLTVR